MFVRVPVVHVQAVIGNYAVPILEDKTVWGTNDDSRTAYMDTQVRLWQLLCERIYKLFA